MAFDSLRVHGGPDAQGPALYDFSTNSNACGPCPDALAAVQNADATRYPDPSYTALRESLAAFHAVEPWRIVLAGSASDFIFRITGWVKQQGGQTVHLPQHAYGDYGHAANAWGLTAAIQAEGASLVWACEPSSPLGQAYAGLPGNAGNGQHSTTVLDCAYAPLRLEGMGSVTEASRNTVWQLYSPNKSLGLTGVRAAYAIAPLNARQAAAQLDDMAPSWLVGAHGVAMLTVWTQPGTQAWLGTSLQTLRTWKGRQIGALEGLGWQTQSSDANFFCAMPPTGVDAVHLCAALRAQRIRLRDASSFGLPGWVRLGVLPPVAQDALIKALTA
jgi:histidinol-phosphate aminotransferase